ncbi:MAG: TraB/GumN family protein [Gammaproteobacteria bacterium]|nr:TraB/GumN family protein [Gammaproteobacteria bacterium]
MNTRARALLLWLSATFLGMSSGMPVLATSTATATTRVEAAKRFEQGLLWRITPPIGKPSFVFGTLHSADQRVLNLSAPVQQSLAQTTSLTIEALLDAAAITTLAERMLYLDERTLPSVLGEALYTETRRAMQEFGLSTELLEKQKPWVVATMFLTPSGVALDLQLQQQATTAGKPVYGLETIAEQVAVFDGLSEADQVQLLKETVRDRATIKPQMEQLTRAYLARDLAGIAALMNDSRPQDAHMHDALMKRLLQDRNPRMVERMEPRLKEGNAFIAIGAAHLGGADGVLALLERKGYRVTMVY